jgi:hypothetical protein
MECLAVVSVMVNILVQFFYDAFVIRVSCGTAFAWASWPGSRDDEADCRRGDSRCGIQPARHAPTEPLPTRADAEQRPLPRQPPRPKHDDHTQV